MSAKDSRAKKESQEADGKGRESQDEAENYRDPKKKDRRKEEIILRADEPIRRTARGGDRSCRL